MAKNKKKFAFIISVNDERYFSECELYINQLRLPSGFTKEIIPVRNSASMAQAYNKGMAMTDAQYKVYLHQDVFILNANFLLDILTVFKIAKKAAMVGVIGSPVLPVTAVMKHGERVGNLYSLDPDNVDFSGYEYRKEHGYTEVQAIDGMIMVTREDLPWREDIFDGWDFYDVSQSFEFRKKGFKVVVPEQTIPWCAHENGGIKSQWSYNKYRSIFIEEYM